MFGKCNRVSYGGDPLRRGGLRPESPEKVESELRTNKVKCPKCGSKIMLPEEGEDVQCSQCGTLLRRKGNKWELTAETEDASLTEFEAEEKWQRDHES